MAKIGDNSLSLKIATGLVYQRSFIEVTLIVLLMHKWNVIKKQSIFFCY